MIRPAKPLPRVRRAAVLVSALMLGLGTAVASPGEAPPPLPDHPLSLQECVRLAVARNPNAAALLHSGRAAMARIGSAQSAYWPTLNLSGSLSRSYTEPSSGTYRLPGTSSTATSDSAALSTQYTLWDSGQRKASVEGAKANYASSDYQFKATVQDLALSVESAYYTLEGAQWSLQVAEDTAKQTQFHLDMAQAQFDHGLVPRSDVLQAATANANAALGVIQAKSAVTSGRAALAVLMGLPADSSFEIQGSDQNAPLPGLPDWQSGKERAMATLPEIKAAFENSESFRFALRQAEVAYRPTVTVDGSYGRFDSGQWPNLEDWSVGLTVHIPLFTGFARTWQVVQAKESWEGSKMSLRETQLTSEKSAYDARTQLETAVESVKAAESLVKSAVENANVAEGQYKNGLGSMTNVVDATTALQNAKYQLVSARLSVLTAQATWDRTTGVDLLQDAELPSTSVTAGDIPALSSGPHPMGETKP
ncbi:MAG: TolC family protein [Acidobacteriota bacterium]